MRGTNVILLIVAFLFPPATVAMIAGCSCDLLIAILLTSLGYIPGLVHAVYLIMRKAEAEDSFGAVHYIGNGHYEPAYIHAGQPHVQAHYGSTNQR
ncbi:hypothetical protein BDV93DRAFT_524424 [Ceratobasidium sp. AG-I]|nr:hypothetical protein BDV93DRAFT_524424 [Ceratobasidium sp. AG-I]